MRWNLLDKPGESPSEFALSAETAVEMYKAAVAAAKKVKLPWLNEEIVLKPSPQLVELVRRSQALATSAKEVPV